MALLHRNEPVALEDWSVLTAGGKLSRDLPQQLTRRDQWALVGRCLASWLELIHFRPHLRISPSGKAEFVLAISKHDFSQLLAVLGLELLFQATRTKRLLTCSSCGRPYSPKRLPTRGERTYCSKCGIRAARRDAAVRWRKKNPDYFRRRAAKAAVDR